MSVEFFMDTPRKIQEDTLISEEIGQFIKTDEKTYFTDESPEYHNKTGKRFVMGEFQQNVREKNSWPYVSPRYFREITTTIVTRSEITLDEYRKEHPLKIDDSDIQSIVLDLN